MPDHNPQHSRRPHYHRGRRGQDRRGGERRPPAQQPVENLNRDNLDVEQIMREIRARISERHGIDLTNQQIQELAARRLEAILDPRDIAPSLMDQLRRSAGMPAEPAPPAARSEPAFTESQLYDSPSGLARLLRRLLNPLLKLLINPQAISDALNAQSRAIEAAAAREAEQRRRQTEWNGLHFEILRRLVTDIARSDIDAQQLGQRVESLGAKVDFNERRVRGLEQAQHLTRPAARGVEAPAATTPATPPKETAGPRFEGPAGEPTPSDGGADGARRRRRRRRGRRSGAGPMRDISGAPVAGPVSAVQTDQADSGGEGEEFADEDMPEAGLTSDSESPPETTPIARAGEPVQPAPVDPVERHAATDDQAVEATAPEPVTGHQESERPPEG